VHIQELGTSLKSFRSEFFSLSGLFGATESKILMRTGVSHVYTGSLPYTALILKDKLPTVHQSKCFNYYNFTFSQEVKNTEMGHLFEHILLEYLCLLKINKGYKSVVFEGITNWDWQKEEKGTFHIKIFGKSTIFEFSHALQKSVELVDFIIRSQVLYMRDFARDLPPFAPATLASSGVNS